MTYENYFGEYKKLLAPEIDLFSQSFNLANITRLQGPDHSYTATNCSIYAAYNKPRMTL